MKRILTSNIFRAAIGFCVAGVLPLAAQGPTFDSSGNSMLNGNYYFRQVFYVIGDNSGGFSEAVSLYGHISFDGNGNYVIADGIVMDTGNGFPVSLSCELAGSRCTSATSSTPVGGTYTIAASGYGYLTNPITGDATYVLVANSGTTPAGIITGSTTENTIGYNDLFIAGKIGSTTPSNSTFTGAWTMAGFTNIALPSVGFSVQSASPAYSASLFFPINPNGAGSLGTVTANGYVGGSGTSVQTQTINNVKYFFSNGAAVVQFPTSNSAVYFSGNEYLYFSPDNNFVFGGSPTGYDMIVGIRNDAAGTAENFTGAYFQGGVDQDVSTFSSQGYANFDTYYGSLGAGGGNIVGSQRIQSVFSANAYSLSFSGKYPASISGSTPVSDTFTQYAYSNSGGLRIGAGIWPYLGLTVAFPSITPTATGSVYLNPTGVANAASSAPFTAGISNGELITLYGTNLAPSTVVAPGIPFPTTLGGVQVTINGIPAPIYYVSSGQVSVIVPYSNPYSIAQISVINNGVPSNNGVPVTVFVDKTSVGLFTKPAGGIGYGALLHNDTGLLVTPSNPAKPGEYIQAFVTGLGPVIPPIADGAAGSSDVNSLNYSTYFSSTASANQITAYINGVSAPVVYAGLAPGLAGLYQVNLQVPAGLTAGDGQIDISGPDTYTSEALIPLGTGASANSSPASASAAEVRRAAPRTRRGPQTTERPVLRQAPPKLSGRGAGSLQ